ncbi:hypothetical protein DFQ27_005699 [Actinomortierella ambigua]|uniref:GATA-type domain-containing protein n=1 Tax=Actinomortierella ambigua TaxID=1343610 RepID=A0A9P6Q1L0_9FUNG|nr:hypothetical protein DFQ27_005699 [Actinomortierella ambigua]
MPNPDSGHPVIGTILPSEGPVHPQPGVVHCFWALMTYGDLRFIYLSDSVQKAVNSKYAGLLGQSFFDFIHPDEAKLARKDLNAFMDVHNLYGSVTRCRFRNVCPDWQRFQQQLRQQQEQQQPTSQQEDKDNSNGIPNNAMGNSTGTDSSSLQTDPSKGSSTTNPEDQLGGFKCNDHEAMKQYQNAFPNGEMDDYMILDVVMNVVGDQVVLGFFHIDGQGPYRGFWSGNKCGESKESLSTLASEILVHLRATTASMPMPLPSLQPQQEKSTTPKDTKRIFQLYDTEKRNLLLTWPEPSADDNPADATKMVYNPEFYTHIVQSHHIPADALANTTCLKRFCSKHAISGQGYPQDIQPILQVESVFIPYGQVIFVCFQTSPSPSLSLPASPSVGLGTLQALSESAYMSGSTMTAGRSMSSTSATVHSSSAGSNPPLVIPSLPSLSPFLKHAVPSPTHAGNGGGGGPIPSSPLSGGSNNHFRPYPKPPSHRSGSCSSNSSSPLLDQPGKLGVNEPDRLSGLSTWHASTPHPAMAAMVGHALSPSSSKYHRSHDSPTSTTAERRLPFPSDHVYQRERTLSSSALEQSSSTSVTAEPDASRPRARTTSSPAFSNGSSIPPGGGSGQSGKSGSRHPAHNAAIRIKTAPLPPSSSSAGRARRESSADSAEDSQHSAASKGGDADSVVSTYSCSNGGLVIRISQEEKTCESCHTTNSPEWRRGPSGKKNLCNACGLRYSRSVARQNRQAQKLAEAKAGGGGGGGGGGGSGASGAKSKGSKKQKVASKTTTEASPTKSSSSSSVEMGSPPQHSRLVNDQQHAGSLSTTPPPLSASLALSPHSHAQPRAVDPRQGYTAATAATLGDTLPYPHHSPQGNLSSKAHSHMSTFV